ncbi:specific RNA polymerase II transcription factor [Nannizzia gypsea CBS 118893]|uniref:Specific RNA polymerase II transcription factor n=1 Tax=Arthroderma gypseum (strain ATCC MYA-4604 / CBS 118893) TaxID=535722 RepID=E5R365_ARTGP|nr:specific RNA polymerase II transcription factor [Nannizzia gypsea CBS 118893]EFQ97094.1 specific RNA polymerase II transcription factor [Nannizzia gypsea CBS 118893]
MGAVFHPHQQFTQSNDTILPSFERTNPQPLQPQPTNSSKYYSSNAPSSSPRGQKRSIGLASKPQIDRPNSFSLNLASSTSGSAGQSNTAYWPGVPSLPFNAGRNIPPSTAADSLSQYSQISPYPSSSGASQPPISQLPQHSQSQDSQQHSSNPVDQHQSQQHSSHTMAQTLMDSQTNSGHISPQASQQQSPLDPYGHRFRYPGPQQSPIPQHPSSFQPYPGTSMSMSQTPVSDSTQRLGMPVQVSVEGQQPLPQYTRPYPSYSLPAMNGPVMSNVHHPSSQMALIGSMQPNLLPGFNSGHAASLQQMYTHQHPQTHHMHGLGPPGPQNDRPFRCDTCQQSFNRNHDLKRHKRIHLAVKPFPCNHCDKSFSRKDALKRHILVKGCGKDPHSESEHSRIIREVPCSSIAGIKGCFEMEAAPHPPPQLDRARVVMAEYNPTT